MCLDMPKGRDQRERGLPGLPRLWPTSHEKCWALATSLQDLDGNPMLEHSS